VIPLNDEAAAKRIATLCADLYDEYFFAREGYRLAMRGLLALIDRRCASGGEPRATGTVTLAPPTRPSRRCGGWWRKTSAKNDCWTLCREARDDGGSAQRSRQARDRRDGGPPDPPARADRSQAQLVFTAQRSTRLPMIWRFPIPRISALFQKADRHHAA